MESLPFWRNIYKGVNGIGKSTIPRHVSETLLAFGDELLTGLLVYKPYTVDSLIEWRKGPSNKQLEILINKIAKNLNLECGIAYSLFCNYLMFEFYGKIDDIEEISRTDAYTIIILEKMCIFYTLERMYYLKTIRFIIEHYNDANHLHRDSLVSFVNKHTLKAITESLLKQYRYLIYEVDAKQVLFVNCLSIKEWVDRNNTEQIELLVTLMHCANAESLTVPMCVSMLNLFVEHDFGLNPKEYFEGIAISNKDDLENVSLLENAVFIVAVKNYWTHDGWFNEMSKFDDIFIEKLNLIADQPLIILCYSMLIMRQPNDIALSKYQQCLPKLLEISLTNQPFHLMVATLEIAFLKGSSSEYILKDCFWLFLNQICLRVDNVILIHHKQSSIKLLASLMEVPELCEKTVDEKNAVHLLFSVAMNMFPHDCDSFCLLAGVMLKHKAFHTKVITCLKQLEIYSEICPYTRMEWFVTATDYNTKIGVVIPKNTPAKIVHLPDGNVLLQFQGNFIYSYFEILERCLSRTIDDNYSDQTLEFAQFCANGLHLMTELIEAIPEFYNNAALKNCVNHGRFFYSKAVTSKTPNMKLIENSFKLCSALIPVQEFDMSHMLISTHSLPIVFSHYQNIKGLLKGNVLSESVIVDLIMQERQLGNYTLLHIYMNLWINGFQKGEHLQKLHLPGTVFFLQEVFPQHLNWKYDNAFSKNKITLKIVNYLFTVLQTSGKMENNMEILIYDFCIEIVFNYVPFIKSFITILRMTNVYIEKIMCREIHWDINRCSDLILTLRTCLSIVLWLFNMRNDSGIKETQFWRYFFYTGTNVCSIVKTLCEYINHQFDPILPKLALSLLRKISQDPTISILACLEMDNYQVECMFLERLRDPLEQMELKVGILELIIVCLKKQNGMTAAFFNLVRRRKLYSTGRIVKPCDDTIVGYFYEYLQNISIAQEYMRGPIQATMLELLHTLWIEKRTILIKDLLEKDTFWKIIINPLIQDYTLDDNTYAQILEILAMEVCKEKISTSLKDILKFMFCTNHFEKKFPAHLKDSLRKPTRAHTVHALQAWTKFLVFMVKFHDDLMDGSTKKSLVTSTIEGLHSYARDPVDDQVVLCWCNLYLYLITHWGTESYCDKNKNFQLVANTFHLIEHAFLRIGKKGKETIISIAIKTIEHFEGFFETDSFLVKKFLDAMKKITDLEYELLFMSYMQRGEIRYIDHVVFTLIVIFGTKLIPYEINHHWFFRSQMMQKVVSVLGHFTKHREILSMTKIMMQLLTEYVKSPLKEEFLHVDFLKLFDSIKIPQDYFNFNVTDGRDMARYEEFWLTYASIINFNLCLIERLKYYVVTPMLMFFRVHQEGIFKIMKLPSITANIYALKLVSNCLRLSSFLITWNFSQNHFYEPLYHSYIKIVAECFNSCINILLRPQVLRVFKTDQSFRLVPVNQVPISFMVDVMNRVIEVIGSSCLVLLDISPQITDMLSNAQYHVPSYLDIEPEFHVPIPNHPNQDLQKLTLGGVLCLVHYLCKTILQILGHKGDAYKSEYVSTSTYLIECADNDSVDKKEAEGFMVFVYPDYTGIASAHDKFSSIQRFANSEIYSLAAPWLSKMNQKQITYVLEIINTLLASQVFKTILKTSKNPLQSQLLKRDLCSEFQFFHEFVRKRLLDQQKYYIEGNLVLKTKATESRNANTESSENDYLLMLSHWFMIICQLTP